MTISLCRYNYCYITIYCYALELVSAFLLRIDSPYVFPILHKLRVRTLIMSDRAKVAINSKLQLIVAIETIS